MADTALVTFAATDSNARQRDRIVVMTDPDTFYIIGHIHETTLSRALDTVGWVKWTRTGGVWSGSAVTTLVAAGAVGGTLDVWFDQWTPGDEGTIIHVAWHDDRSFTTEGVYYWSLDTADDSTTGPTRIWAETSGNADSWGNSCVTITKARSGRLYIAARLDDAAGAGDVTFISSANGGATWDATSLDKGPLDDDASLSDYFVLFPGNEADAADVWLIFVDRSEATDNVLLYVYDQSAGTWSSPAIITTQDDHIFYVQIGGMIRHSDGHLILVVGTGIPSAASFDCEVWDINGMASIVAKTDVWTADANKGLPALLINQQNDDLYVGYVQGESAFPGGTVSAKMVKSSDGGTTWGAPTSLSATSSIDVDSVYPVGLSIGPSGGQIGFVFFDDAAVGPTLRTDFDVWIEVAAEGPPEGAATLALEVGTEAQGYVTPLAASALALEVGIESEGHVTQEGAATLALEVGIEAEGHVTLQGAAVLGLEVDLVAQGAAVPNAAAALALEVGLEAEGYALPEASASLDLILNLRPVGLSPLEGEPPDIGDLKKGPPKYLLRRLAEFMHHHG